MKQRFLFTAGAIAASLWAAVFAQNSSNTDFEIITQKRDVPAFHSIDVTGRFRVVISPADEQEISISAPEKLLDAVETSVSNGVLRINMTDALKGIDANVLKNLKTKFNDYLIRQPIEIRVNVSRLESITAKGASRIETEHTLSANDFELNLSGASKGDLNLQVGNSLTVSLAEAARLDVEGSAQQASINANGASALYGTKLHIKDVRLLLNGASRAEMHVTDTIEVELHGATKAVCTGNPRIVKQQVSRGSSITMK